MADRLHEADFARELLPEGRAVGVTGLAGFNNPPATENPNCPAMARPTKPYHSHLVNRSLGE